MTEIINQNNQNNQNNENNYLLIEGKKIYPVYNNSNFLISIDEIKKILEQGKLEVEIRNIKLFQQSFIHKSMCKSSDFDKNKKYYGNINAINNDEVKNYLQLQESSNEVLEWLGDSFIQSIISLYLYERYPNSNEGFLTKIRSRLVKTETLSKIALALNFDKYMVISKHVEIIMNGRKNAKLLEDCFEAFLGALLYDLKENKGIAEAYDLVKKFFINVTQYNIDITELILKDDNFKDQLMRYFQKEFNGEENYPKYEQLSVENNVSSVGISNRKFHICVKDLEGHIVGEGIAKSKKEAEQKAAENALKHYGVF